MSDFSIEHNQQNTLYEAVLPQEMQNTACLITHALEMRSMLSVILVALLSHASGLTVNSMLGC